MAGSNNWSVGKALRWCWVLLGLLAATPAVAKPNFLVVITDDMTPALLQHMPLTRALVADQGTTFSNSFVNVNLCCPGRATLLTGRYAHNTGIKVNKNAAVLFQQREPDTIAALLSANGYRTGLFGKYLNGYVDAAHVPVGWERWLALTVDTSARVDPTVSDNGVGRQLSGHTTELLADAIEAFIGAVDERPFLVWLSTPEPHTPYTVPLRHAGLFAGEQAPRPASFAEPDVSDKPARQRLPPLDAVTIATIDEAWRGALRSVQLVDETVSRLLALVPDDTIVVFTSDNGYFFGEHRIVLRKFDLYDAGLRVPLMFAGPSIGAGSVRSELAVNADLAPTLLALAEVAIPATMDGRSLAPQLRGESPMWRRSFPTGRFNSGQVMATGIRSVRHTFVRYGDGAMELYDNLLDPDQLQNRSSDPLYRKKRDKLRNRATALSTCAGATCRSLEDQPIP